VGKSRVKKAGRAWLKGGRPLVWEGPVVVRGDEIGSQFAACKRELGGKMLFSQMSQGENRFCGSKEEGWGKANYFRRKGGNEPPPSLAGTLGTFQGGGKVILMHRI